MSDLEFILIKDFKCKRCGCTHYDKMMYTGFKQLDDEDSIIGERYVCRNCDLPFNISDYIKNDTIHMSSQDLIKESEFVDEGVDATANINGEEIKINSNKGVI